MAIPRKAFRIIGFAVMGGLAAFCNLSSRVPFFRIMRYELAVEVQQITGHTVELAYVDQAKADEAQKYGIQLEVIKHPRQEFFSRHPSCMLR